jgi:colicin import membrane protein
MSVAAGALQYQEPGKVPSAVLAVAVHVLLAVFLFFGVRWQSSQPEAVVVELWTSPPAPPVEPVVAPPPPMPEIKPELKVEKAIEPPKPDIALEKKKEIKKELPKKPEPKLDLDRSKDIRAQLESETAQLKQQLDKERILDQMKREGAAQAARADAAYIGKLKGRIKSNVVLPQDIPGNPEAIFDVVQLPITGDVMSVKLRKSSGHKAYDEAVERAILKSTPLPLPDRPEQFQRNLEIKFRPLDLK